jgi:DNA-binding transcriptional LysR family regulator
MNATGASRWDDLRLLLAVARSGSFTGAARATSLATSTLSRRLTALESTLGVALVERRSDGVRLTEAGRRLAATAEEVDLALRARVRDLPASSGALSGTIRVTAGDGFSDFLVESIARFRVTHSRVGFELALDERPLDLRRREADVAVRTVHGREGSLVYRSVGALPYGLFAGSRYVARHGVPRTARELARHDVLGLPTAHAGVAWMRWLTRHGASRFALRSSSFVALLGAARAGLGIAPLPLRLGTGLVRVLPRTVVDPLPTWIVSHPDARRVPAVRAFLDHLAQSFDRERTTADPHDGV